MDPGAKNDCQRRNSGGSLSLNGPRLADLLCYEYTSKFPVYFRVMLSRACGWPAKVRTLVLYQIWIGWFPDVCWFCPLVAGGKSNPDLGGFKFQEPSSVDEVP